MFGLQRIGVQSRFILLMLLVSLGSILAIGWIGYRSAREAITNAVQNHLQSVRYSKTRGLLTLLESLRDQVISLSDGKLAAEAMVAFKQSYRSLDGTSLSAEQEEALRSRYMGEFLPALQKNLGGTPQPEQYLPASPAQRYLQYHYVASATDEGGADASPAADDASAYGRVHAAIHERLDRLGKLFGYEDILLIDDDTLEIVYSLRKRPDFATSLRNGPYASTNLAKAAEVLARDRDRDAFKVVDTELYRPHCGRPVGFVLSPIFNGPEMAGILALEFPVDRIAELLTGNFQWEREGMGKSGECYVVGPDFTMRSRSRFMVEDARGFVAALRTSPLTGTVVDQIERQGTVLNQLPVKTHSTEQALLGREGITLINDYRGVPVLSSYGPLDLNSLRWAVVAEMDVAEAYQPIHDYARRSLLAATALALLTSLLALLSSWLLVRPLKQLAAAARKIGAGESAVSVDLHTRDEFGELARVFNEMATSLRRQRSELEEKARENQELLLNILPLAAIEQRRDGDEKATRQFADVTVVVAEFRGVDEFGGRGNDSRSLSLLGDLVAACDEAADRCGVEKVRAVGAMYLAVCGLSVSRPDHAARALEFAREVARIAAAFDREHGAPLASSIGINSGPVVGGVVGRHRFLYDLWGDTVAIASQLAARQPGAIHVTQQVHDRLSDLCTFTGPVEAELRGQGNVKVWTLAT
ncbi:MAG: adenylate/guanylate cyclase domain-containing protein [Planctomycetia bacterium]